MIIECRDGVKLYVEQKGNGDVCMFIHGGPGAWFESFKEFAGEKFENLFSMIYFDQRGCGRSEGNENTDYSLARLVEDIEDIRKKLKIEKLIILAHSFGGVLAINYATKYKNCVDRLILMNVTLDMMDSLKNQLEYGMRLLGEQNTYSDRDLLEKWNITVTKLINKGEFFKFYYNKKESSRIVDRIDSKIENRSMANQAFSNKEYFQDFTCLTRKIGIPTLIVSGNNDYAIGKKHYKKFKFPNYSMRIIDGKHGIYVEKTAELISAIEEFMSKKY